MNTLLKPSAHFVKPSFISMVESGRSLIFVESKSAGNRVRELLNSVQLTATISVTAENPLAMALDKFNRECWPNGRLLMNTVFGHGYPVSYVDAAYSQVMSRGDMPWGQPAKWHYSESELFN